MQIEHNTVQTAALRIGDSSTDNRLIELTLGNPRWNYVDQYEIDAPFSGTKEIDLSPMLEVGQVFVLNLGSSSFDVSWRDKDSGSVLGCDCNAGEFIVVTNPDPGVFGSSTFTLAGSGATTPARIVAIGRTPELASTAIDQGEGGPSVSFFYYDGIGPIDVNTTTLANNFRLSSINVSFASAPLTSEDLEYSIDSGQGTGYDVVLQTIDPKDVGGTRFLYEPAVESFHAANDQVAVSYPGTDGIAWTVRIAIEVL